MRHTELKRIIRNDLFCTLTCGSVNSVKKIPAIVKSLKEARVNLDTVYVDETSILKRTISARNYRCLAYFLDLGLDPFKLDTSEVGWSAAHETVIYLACKPALIRLMGFVFADPRFFSLENHLGKSPSVYLSEHKLEDREAVEEMRAIFIGYNGFHDSAKRAESLIPSDHLLAALHYFLAANQMKTEVADKEDDAYLKRFHLKKVMGDLREAAEHYYQAILIANETPVMLDEFDRCLALSAKIIDFVEPDHPDIDWEIKLGNADTFRTWNEQLMLLQNWREEKRRESFSSTGSESSVAADDAKKEDERTALLGELEELRFRG